jgi:K319-like protein
LLRGSIAIFLFVSLALSVIPAIQNNYTEPIIATAQTVDTELSTEQKRLINQTASRIVNANPDFVGNVTIPSLAATSIITALAQVIERIVVQTSNPDQIITHIAIETGANPTGPLSQGLLLFGKQLVVGDTIGVNQLASLVAKLTESPAVNATTTQVEGITGNISQLILQQSFQSALGTNQLLNQIAAKLAANSSKLSVNNVTISADAIAQTIQNIIIQVSLHQQVSFQPLLFIANQVNQNPLGPLSKSIVRLAQLQTTGGVGASQSVAQSMSELVKQILASAAGNVTESTRNILPTTTEQTSEDQSDDQRTKVIIRDDFDDERESPILQLPSPPPLEEEVPILHENFTDTQPPPPPALLEDNLTELQPPITNETTLIPPPPQQNVTAGGNQTAQLRVITEVINDNGGNNTAEDFRIYIAEANASFADTVVVPFPGAPAPDGTVLDFPAGTYKMLAAPLELLLKYGTTFEGDCDITGHVILEADGPAKSCTVKLNDRIAGAVRVVTDAINDNGGNRTDRDFGFSIVLPGFLRLLASSGSSDGVTYPLLFDRTYTIEQEVDPRYNTTIEGDCVNVAAVENQTKTCNIVNNDVAGAQLTVIKEVINDNGGTKTDADVFVRISNSRGDSIGSRALSPAAPARNARIYDLALGTYDLDGLGGFDYLTTFEGDCDSTGKVTLGADEPSKGCTVKFDDKIRGAVKVVTDVINDNGDNKTAGDFRFGINRAGLLTNGFRGAPPPDGITLLTPSDSYNIIPSAVSGYTTTLEGDCTNVSIVENETKTCTIINDDVAGAELRVITQVINDNGGNKTAEDFRIFILDANETFTPGLIPAVPSTQYGGPPEGTILDKRPGTYIIIGSSLGNYRTTFEGDCDNTGRVTLVADGPAKSCTIIINDVEPAQLKVITEVINDNGGNKTARDFLIRIFNPNATTSLNAVRTSLVAGPVPGSPPPDGTIFNLAPSTYFVVGSPLSTYGMTLEGDCDGRARVTLTAGQPPKICTVKLDDRLPGLVKAKVVTDVINDDGGNKTARDFRFDIVTATFQARGMTGAPPPDGRTVNMPAFSYTIIPRAVPGYTATLEGDCTDVLVVENQTKTCTIINNDTVAADGLLSPPPTNITGNQTNGTLLVQINVKNDDGVIFRPGDIGSTVDIYGHNSSHGQFVVQPQIPSYEGEYSFFLFPASYYVNVSPGPSIANFLGNYTFSTDCGGPLIFNAGDSISCSVIFDDVSQLINGSRPGTGTLHINMQVINDDTNSTLEASDVFMNLAVYDYPDMAESRVSHLFRGSEEGITFTLPENKAYVLGWVGGPPNHDISGSDDCYPAVIEVGANKTCTITVDDRPEAQMAQTMSLGNTTLQNLTSFTPTTSEKETICDDGIDNDNDLKVDAADEDCLLISSTATPEDNTTMTSPSAETELQPAEENNPPNADAGEDSSVESGKTVKLNGEGSNDPDANQDLSYLWEQVSPGSPSVSLDGAKNTIASFKAPEVEKDTKFKFELTVDDGKGGKDTDTVTVAVFGSAEEGQEQEQQKEQEQEQQKEQEQEQQKEQEQEQEQEQQKEDKGQQPETSSEQVEQEQEQQDDESP